ncbi:MAG: hypothetical protein ACMUEL_02575 [Flavobacteriales bacterium Tduv]
MSKTRWGVERWFGSGKARYKGLAHVHTQPLIGGMPHNLYRSSGIIMSCS